MTPIRPAIQFGHTVPSATARVRFGLYGSDFKAVMQDVYHNPNKPIKTEVSLNQAQLTQVLDTLKGVGNQIATAFASRMI